MPKKTKPCRKCRKIKALSAYAKNVNNKDGLTYTCKACVNETRKRVRVNKAKQKPVKKIPNGTVLIDGTNIITKHQKLIDLENVKNFAAIGCTNKEIAALLKISRSNFTMAIKNNPILKEILEEGRHEGNASLRRKQMQVALAGSVPMLVWLGKNKLGQSDRSINHIELSQGDTFKKALLESNDEQSEDDELDFIDDL